MDERMGFKKTRKATSYSIILFIFLLGCSNHPSNDKLLDFKIQEVNDILLTSYYGEISGVDNNSLFLWRNNNFLTEVDIINEKITNIGIVGEAPGEYLRPSYTIKYKGFYYIKDSSSNKIIIFDSLYTFIDEYKVYEKISQFKFLNDSLIFYTNTTQLKNFFCIYDLKKREKIFSFGEAIDYPKINDRSSLIHNGKIISFSKQWDVRDSLLIWYDYYNNQFRVYNIIDGKLLKTFGRDLRNWSTPPVFKISGDQYHSARNIVASSPCENILISENYIYACFSKIWEYNWWLRDYDQQRLTDIKSHKYILVDVYSRENFNYIGSFYPLDQYITYEDNFLLIKDITLANDTVLNFYLQDRELGLLFRKVEIIICLKDTSLD